MKSILTAIFICLSIHFLVGQDYAVIFQSGVSFPLRDSPNLPNIDFILKENRKITYTPGIKFRYSISNNFALKLGALFEERGWYAEVYNINPLNGSVSIDRTNFYYSFITFPTLAEFSIGRNLQLYLCLGLNNSLRVGGATIVGNERVETLDFIYPADKSPTLDFSYNVDFGVSIKISNALRVSLESSYFRSLTPIGNSHPIEEEIFHKGFRFLLGIERLLKFH